MAEPEVRALASLDLATISDAVDTPTGAGRNLEDILTEDLDLLAALLEEPERTLGARVGGNFGGGGAYTDRVHSDLPPQVVGCGPGSGVWAAPAGPSFFDRFIVPLPEIKVNSFLNFIRVILVPLWIEACSQYRG
jgi:hypothetical protein